MLVGDLARCCISHVGAVLGELLPLALANLEAALAQQPANNSACNNACWALGEVAIKVRAACRHWAGCGRCGTPGCLRGMLREHACHRHCGRAAEGGASRSRCTQLHGALSQDQMALCKATLQHLGE